MLGIFILIGLLIFLYIQTKNYKTSEYYQMTHVPFFSLYFDTGKLGEYYTYKYLNSLQGYKKYLFNCYVPKEDGSTTEIDIICLELC
uniref:hypothetical protein n=1 Tax=Acetatifactor sp. TaxID=1872090 RepID=UPI004057B79A